MPPSETQQNPTKPNIQQPQTEKKELKTIHLKAVKLKLLGYRYELIAEELNRSIVDAEERALAKLTPAQIKDRLPVKLIPEHRIRAWFMQGGICHDEFERQEEQRKADLEIDYAMFDNQLKEGAMDAIALLRKLVRDDNIKAAEDILDRHLGRPVQPNKLSGSLDTPGMTTALEALSESLKTIASSQATAKIPVKVNQPEAK